MTKKLRNIINKSHSVILILAIILVWQGLVSFRIVPEFMLPSPVNVVGAFISEFQTLMYHSVFTLTEAVLGLIIATAIAFLLAILMDRYDFLYKSCYPLLIISQTIPVIAIAPLLILWLGYGILPKLTLVFLVCFFPMVVGLLDGFRSTDKDLINLLKSMGASKVQIFWHLKIPNSATSFFSGLKIAVTYSVVGAVISEWLGGQAGLGVYMTRVRKSYAFDKMFAVILLVSVISLLLMFVVKKLGQRATPHR